MSIAYRKVEQGKALVITGRGRVQVSFTTKLVWPVLYKVETMDISLKTIEIDRRGPDGLICKDNIRADIKVAFFVKVNKAKEDVIKVAQAIGCVRASDRRTLEELFSAKFSEALKTVGKQLDFIDLYTKREEFRDAIIQVIGRDLNGYVLEDAAIDYLEQTPMSSLDEDNILDAQGIRKITELTTVEHVKTNDFENTEKKMIMKQNVEAREAILELERQQAEAEAKQQREVSSVQAREKAEALKVNAEEKLKAESARVKTEEEIQVCEENKARQVGVAQKNRERVLAVENERVEKDRALEAIGRERETELQQIAKEKAVEIEKKEIADVIRERLAVEHTMAEEEEKIKALRVVQEADRMRQAKIIGAEAEAQEKLVKDLKEAEADERMAVHKAKERLTLAEAELEATDRVAQAKIRLAEGVQAEAAAGGLAEVRVREADAAAIEKIGLAEARVTLEKMQAQAKGEEIQGDAKAHVKEADATASEKKGIAEAAVCREKGIAEATAAEKQGVAGANVLRLQGLAQAEAIEKKLAAEASGLAEKAAAMKALDEAGRGHEEYRLRLDVAKTVELEAIEARRHVADAQAQILGEALKHAKIDIVGGEGIFLDRLVNAVSMGKSVDGFFDRSEAAQAVAKDYLTGDADLASDVKEVLTRPAMSAQDVQSLSLSAILARLIASSDGEGKTKLDQLMQTARQLGVDKVEL